MIFKEVYLLRGELSGEKKSLFNTLFLYIYFRVNICPFVPDQAQGPRTIEQNSGTNHQNECPAICPGPAEKKTKIVRDRDKPGHCPGAYLAKDQK